jgi:hypothetical protein
MPSSDNSMGNLAEQMATEEITKKIKDPSIVDWMLPDFTTTEDKDRFVASISIMSTLQHYFEYSYGYVTCGIPEVILLGTVADW